MSRDRGQRLQRALASYLRTWWPSAESTPNGRPGSDVLGTPGIVWECKTAREFRVLGWVHQARRHAWEDQVPVTIYWPQNVGEGSPEAVMAIVPLPVLVGLLAASGYTGQLEAK
jgi:hypothetical protein